MGILDDFGNAVSDVWDAGVNLVKKIVEGAEEAVEEVGKVILDEILGLDDLTGEGSEGGSDGHEGDADWGDNASGLQVVNLTDALFKPVTDAQQKPDFLNLLWTDDIQGTVNDLVTEPDATHVFDKVAGPVSEIVTTIGPQDPGIAETTKHEANATADSLLFINQQPASPEWTDVPAHDPGVALLQLPPSLAESIFTDVPGPSLQSPSVQMPGLDDPAFGTTLEDAAQTPWASWLL